MNRLVILALLIALSVSPRALTAADKPVSFYQDMVPVFKRSCNGCHHPGKLKGQLDLTTYAAFLKGGKHGPGFATNDLKASLRNAQSIDAKAQRRKET